MSETETETETLLVHLNARIRGMKSNLLSPAAVDEILSQGDLQRMIDTLLDSDYRHEMAEALTRHHGADAVEEAVSRNLVETFQGLIRRAQGEVRELATLFLGRWDLAAVKSLLRAKHHGLDAREAVTALFPGPKLTVATLHEFAALESMEALIEALIVWNRPLCRGLREAFVKYREHPDLAVLEEALDQHYFVDNARKLRASDDEDVRRVREYLQLEIDRINLRTLFQHLQANVGHPIAQDAFLAQGKLGEAQLREMAATGSVASAVEMLGTTRYQALVDELYPLLQTERFAPVERFLERLFMRSLRKMARQEVFGIGILMDFAWQKYNEVVNLRLVARGLAGHLPPGRVREELFFL